MNKIITSIVIILLLIVGAFFLFNRQTEENSSMKKEETGSTTKNAVIITISANDYSPNKITIKKGQTVTFENKDTKGHWPASAIHPTHLIYPEFDPKKEIPAGNSWSFKFDKAGIWRFHDHIYPNLTGAITVE